jgi:pyruvate dehydrogenase E2 component (dihydrolipoamide acetyltransferase)
MLMPLLGQTMEEGTIIKWFKNEGESVKAGEPLLEVLTDKVNMEVEAPESGTLRKIMAQPDEIVPVKDPICIIGSPDESIDDLLGGEAPAKEETASAREQGTGDRELEQAPAAAPAPSEPTGRIFSSPAARRVAREHGIDIAALAGRGTGPNGRIVEKDVLDFVASRPKVTPLAGKMAADLGVDVAGLVGTGVSGKVTGEDVRQAAAAPAAPAAAIGTTMPFAGMRKMVAKNVAASYQSAVHVTLVTEVDMTECVRLRNQILPVMEKTYGVRVSYTDIIVKAAALAILDRPSGFQGDQGTCE